MKARLQLKVKRTLEAREGEKQVCISPLATLQTANSANIRIISEVFKSSGSARQENNKPEPEKELVLSIFY